MSVLEAASANDIARITMLIPEDTDLEDADGVSRVDKRMRRGCPVGAGRVTHARARLHSRPPHAHANLTSTTAPPAVIAFAV